MVIRVDLPAPRTPITANIVPGGRKEDGTIVLVVIVMIIIIIILILIILIILLIIIISDVRTLPASGAQETNCEFFPNQKCCADSLSMCPRTQKNNHVHTLKIPSPLSEFAGLFMETRKDSACTLIIS